MAETTPTSDAASGDATGEGQGASAAGGEAYEGPVGEGEGRLTVLAWPGYAEDGSTDPAVDWVTPFEQASGCEVEREDLCDVERGGAVVRRR